MPSKQISSGEISNADMGNFTPPLTKGVKCPVGAVVETAGTGLQLADFADDPDCACHQSCNEHK